MLQSPRVRGQPYREWNEIVEELQCPRVRGQRVRQVQTHRRPASIPHACTGAPCTNAAWERLGCFDPSVYGGNTLGYEPYLFPALQSPRVRGQPHQTPWEGPWRPSIPACTGATAEPTTTKCSICFNPRVYGGNHSNDNRLRRRLLQSPCVRGQRPTLAVYGAASLPTGATVQRKRRMQQNAGATATDSSKPRVYGGNVTRTTTPGPYPLQSPCVRGRPQCHNEVAIRDASIPVCTGATLPEKIEDLHDAFNPRVYGGNPRRFDISYPIILPWSSHSPVSYNRPRFPYR